MIDRAYPRLFDVAFRFVAIDDVDRKKDVARRCANSAATVITGTTKEDEADLHARLTRDLGVRGATALIDAAKKLRPPAPKRKWKPSDSPKIAIITGSETADDADALYASLTAAGADCWFYGRSIRIGRRILNEDENALQDADYIVLLVSRDALSANWVDWELNVVHWLEMRERRERLLPVIVDDLQHDELPPRLGPLSTPALRDLGGVEGVVAEIAARVAEDHARSKEESLKR